MNTLNVRFYLKTHARKGQPVPYMRVTINSMPAILKSLKVTVPEHLWDDSRDRVKGHSELAVKVNKKIKEYTQIVEDACEELDQCNHHITGSELREKSFPKKRKNGNRRTQETEDVKNSVLNLFRQFIEYKRERGVQEASIKATYQQVYNKLVLLLEEFYKKNDISVEQLDPYFISNFVDKFPCDKGTMKNRISILKAFFRWLKERSQRLIASRSPDGFAFDVKIVYPNYDELVYARLVNQEPAEAHTQGEYDKLLECYHSIGGETLGMYLFQIETGMAYADIAAFISEDHIQKNISGELYISKRREKYRHKTNPEYVFVVPLSPFAKELLDKHAPEGFFPSLRPKGKEDISRKYARRLDPIGAKLGLKLKPHKARHTFGTFRLEAGYSMTAVQKMMGHKNINSTMIYAKMTNRGVWDEHHRVQSFSKGEVGNVQKRFKA